MRYRALFVLTALLMTTLANAQKVERKSLAVTVYNSELGVVKDTRVMDIPAGFSEIKLMDVASAIDPTSVHISLNGIIHEQNYRYDLVSMYKILQKYLDRQVSLIDDKGAEISGILLSGTAGQIVIKKQDGSLTMLPNLEGYKINVADLPDGLITVPTLVWMVESRKMGKQDVEVSYQTGGMSWQAEYVAVLNENDTKTDFNSWVSVTNNSGASYPDAKLKLVAGDVNRVRDEFNYADGLVMREAMSVEKQMSGFEEKSFFEYHIYNLQRPTTLANNETKQISLFEAKDVKVKKEYYYVSQFYGGSEMGSGKVAVVIKFENKKENNLGMPMPKGKVRLYKSDGESLEFIGEDMIEHTPKNEELKLKVGDAFDIVVEERMIEEKKISKNVYEYDYEVKIRNRKDEAIEVNIEKNLYGDWEILKSNHVHEKKTADKAAFKVPVGKDDETVLSFKVRIKI